MNIYCDIDGTLTNDGDYKYGSTNFSRVRKLRELSEQNTVYLWSGNGQQYAETFRLNNRMNHCIAIGKPHLIIDDNPTIRPNWNNLIKKPEYLD